MWRYFGRSSGGAKVFEIYRWPANGLRLDKQKIEDVQLLRKDGTWAENFRETLMRELFDGWFDEETDEMSAEQVNALFEKWQQSGWPGKN
jgi:hypothetical protein